MRISDLADLIDFFAREYEFDEQVEITLECNPGTVTKKLWRDFRSVGVNRVSIGVQSLSEKYLHRFGRIHSADEALKAVTEALDSGLFRVNADLIFGFPGQELSEWQSDLDEILQTGLSHLSCYALTAEEGTIYSKALRRKEYCETESELFAEMLNYTYARTQEYGLPAYEVSNFAKPGEESLHNLGYWRYQSYIGLGAGATGNFFTRQIVSQNCPESRIVVLRTQNVRNPESYRIGVQKEKCDTFEKIDLKTAMSEFMLMGLRLTEGVSKAEFECRFGRVASNVYGEAIDKAIQQGWLKDIEGRLKPTLPGFIFNNALSLLFL